MSISEFQTSKFKLSKKIERVKENGISMIMLWSWLVSYFAIYPLLHQEPFSLSRRTPIISFSLIWLDIGKCTLPMYYIHSWPFQHNHCLPWIFVFDNGSRSGTRLNTRIMLAPATTKDFSARLKKWQLTACSTPVAGWVSLHMENMVIYSSQSISLQINCDGILYLPLKLFEQMVIICIS